MIARSNLDLLSALAQTGAAQTAPISVPAAQNQRFDAALLQAAKAVKDGQGQGAQIDNTLTPKVEQALENLLDQWSQQPEDQVRQLAKQPELLKPAVEALTQAYALDPEEAKALASAVPLLSKGLVQALDSIEVSTANTVELATPGKISGPQGGEPGTSTVDPAQTLKPEAPVAQAPVQTDKRERATEIPATLAPALVWAPVLVSTRTDSGSSADAQVSLASRPVEAASAPQSPAPISAYVSPQALVQNVTAAAAGPAAPQAVAPVQAQAPVVLSVISAQPQAQAPQAAQSPSATGSPEAVAPAARRAPQALPVVLADEGTVRPQVEAQNAAPNVPSTGQAPTTRTPAVKSDAPAPKNADEQLLDFKVASPSAPSAPVKEDSVFILNGDGSTQGAQASFNSPNVEAAQASPQPQAAPAPQNSVAPSRTATVAAPVIPAAPVFVPSATVPPVVQAPVEAPQPAAPVVAANIPAATPALAPTVDVQRPVSASSPAPQKTAEATSSDVPFEPTALENSAGFQALTRNSNQEEAPQTGLGFGQSTLRQVLNQVAKELGVQDAAFSQVSEALAATGKETSRLLIKLKPASLGEVQVDLGMEGGKLTARLVASSAEVRDAFVRDLPAFKASLEAQGIKIEQVSVAVRAGSDLNPQSQGQAQQQPQGFWGAPADAAVPSFSAPVTQSAWTPAAANDQLFSALA